MEESTIYPGPQGNIENHAAECKEECRERAKAKGAPFWTFNHKQKRCYHKSINNAKPNGNWQSGNTDESCDFSPGCDGGSKLLFARVAGNSM